MGLRSLYILLTLSVQGPSVYVGIWHLQMSDSDVYRRVNKGRPFFLLRTVLLILVVFAILSPFTGSDIKQYCSLILTLWENNWASNIHVHYPVDDQWFTDQLLIHLFFSTRDGRPTLKRIMIGDMLTHCLNNIPLFICMSKLNSNQPSRYSPLGYAMHTR